MIEDPSYEPSPDELLLELHDLVTLAFPQPLVQATITFVATPDGTRPALTDLNGNTSADAPQRPDLGHVDSEVLDGINGLLGELADATERQGGVRVVEGRLEFDGSGSDGESNVTLIEVQGAESIVRMRRRFDRSELNWLFFTPALFRALNATEAREQEQHAALLQALKPYGSFQIDMSQGRITFAPKTGSSLEPRSYAFELVGSWSEKTRRLLWAFANESAHPRLKRRSERVRAQSTELGLRALHEGDLGCPEKMAERLARHVAVVTEATGLYRAPFKSELGAGFMYLALIDAQPSTVGPT